MNHITREAGAGWPAPALLHFRELFIYSLGFLQIMPDYSLGFLQILKIFRIACNKKGVKLKVLCPIGAVPVSSVIPKNQSRTTQINRWSFTTYHWSISLCTGIPSWPHLATPRSKIFGWWFFHQEIQNIGHGETYGQRHKYVESVAYDAG